MTTEEHGSESVGQALPNGTRIEEFVIERVLGSGGFGITYLARDTGLNRQVVIKENLPAQFCFRDTVSGTVRSRQTTGGDADDFQWSMNNFLREAETLASLDHSGIVRVLRKFEACGTAYFVMPFVEGVAFDALIEEWRAEGRAFSEAELRGLLDRLLGSLGYLHERGIYHRDIKPANILITNEGIPVLIDFGSARQRLSERSMTVIESPGYTPFEQLQSRGNVGPWSDLYALGATLVKAITGEAPPKATDRAFDDPWMPLAERAELGAIYSPGFLSRIDRALALHPRDRWKDAGAWLTAIRMESTMESSNSDSARLPPVVLQRERLQAPVPSQPISTAISDGKSSPVKWIIALCVILGLGVWAMIESNRKQEEQAITSVDGAALQRERDRAEAAATQAKDAVERAARAEREKQTLVEEVKAKEEAIKAAEQQRLAAPVQAKADKVIKATKEQPFENSLGMRFVPVKITGGPSDGQQVLFGVWETRLQDFEKFANNSKSYRYESGITSDVWDGKEWEKVEGASWKSPGYAQTATDPVTCISCLDAVAFCEWLTQVERKAEKIPADARYRLPTDHEWSCAVGIGGQEDAAATPASKDGKIADIFPWGTQWPPPGQSGNYADSLKVDHYQRSSPVGSFPANDNGIHDLGGNVWEWCDAIYEADNSRRVLRGASWLVNGRGGLSSSYRNAAGLDYRGNNVGFRCVLIMGVPVALEQHGPPEVIEKMEPKVDAMALLKAAEAGDSMAMWQAGRCYDEGMGLTADKNMAVIWYQKSAEAGNPEGMFLLGLSYELGSVIAPNWPEAEYWYQKAMNLEHEATYDRYEKLKSLLTEKVVPDSDIESQEGFIPRSLLRQE